MRKIFLFLMFLQTCAYSSIAFVQGNDTTNSASVTSFKIRYPSNVTAGNSLIVDVHSYSSNASHSIADSRGNTWQLIDTVYYSAQTEKVTRWRVKATAGGADTVTVTFGASLSYWRCAIMEYSGLDTSTLYYDTKDSINATLAANNQTGKVKINAIGDLVLSTIQITGTDATVTAGTGYTMRQSTTGTLNLYVEDTITTTTDSIMGKWTNSAAGSTKWLALTTSFKASAACTKPSSFSYSTSPISDTVGKVAVTQTATITGTVDSFKVIGTALPGGLSLNKNTGAITGTPTTETAKAGYQIRAYGCLDSVSTYDSITVIAAPVDSGSFALTDMTANRVWQRQTAAGVPGGAQCSVTVAGRCKKYTTTIKALVRHIAGDTVVNWTTIATSPDSGNFSKKISVPSGCWYKVSICDNLADTVHGSNRFGVGDVWLVIGQSNIMGWNANLSAARDTSSDSCVNFSRLSWQRMIDPMCDLGGSHGATPFVKLGKMLVAKTGYPHAFINAAKGGTKLNGNWDDRHVPLTDTSYLYNRAYQYASLSGGKIFGIIMGQGENDAKDGTSGATYQVKFDTIINRFRADLGHSTMPVFYFMIGRIPNFATNANLSAIQNAQLALDDSTKKYYLCAAWWDLAMDTDSLHLTLASNDTLGKRFGVKISRWYDGVFDKYPKITSFTHSGTRVIKLNTTATQLSSISQLPNLIITKKNGDTIPVTGISVSGAIVYDTLNTSYVSDSLKGYYADNRFPSATYVLKDTGGFPIPQYWGPYYFDNISLCTLTVVAGANGTVSRSEIIDSTNVTFRDTATANTSYLFYKWTVRHGGVTFADSMSRFASMTVIASDTVNAIFRPEDTIGTWAAATGKTKMDSLENYTWDPAKPGSFSTDVTLKFNNTSTVNASASSGMSVKKVIKSAGYTGLWTFNPSSGIFSVVNGFIDSSASANSTNITKEFRMTGNGQFKSHRGAGAGVINPPVSQDFAFLGQYDTLNWRNTISVYNLKCAQNATDTFRLLGNVSLCPIFNALNMGSGVFNIVNSQQVVLYCNGGSGQTALTNSTNTFTGSGATFTIGPNVAGTWTVPKIRCVGGPTAYLEFLSTNAAIHVCTLNVTDTVGFRTIYVNADAACKSNNTINFKNTSVLSIGASYTLQVGNNSSATPAAKLNVHWGGTVLDSGLFDGTTWNADTTRHFWDSGSVYFLKTFKLGTKSFCSATKTNFYFIAANSCTLTTNNQTLGHVYIRKSKTATVRTRIATDFACLNFQIDSGKFYQDKHVITARRLSVPSTDTAKFDSTIILDSGITIAAGSKAVFATGSSIQFTTCNPAIDTAGWGGTLPTLTYPVVGPISYDSSDVHYIRNRAIATISVTNIGCGSSYTKDTLPPGILLNGSTGAITGTPTSIDTLQSIITVTGNGGTAKDTITFNIVADRSKKNKRILNIIY